MARGAVARGAARSALRATYMWAESGASRASSSSGAAFPRKSETDVGERPNSGPAELGPPPRAESGGKLGEIEAPSSEPTDEGPAGRLANGLVGPPPERALRAVVVPRPKAERMAESGAFESELIEEASKSPGVGRGARVS